LSAAGAERVRTGNAVGVRFREVEAAGSEVSSVVWGSLRAVWLRCLAPSLRDSEDAMLLWLRAMSASRALIRCWTCRYFTRFSAARNSFSRLSSGGAVGSIPWVGDSSVGVSWFPSGVALSGAAGGLVGATGRGSSFGGSDGSSMTSWTRGSGSEGPSPLFGKVFLLPLGGMPNVRRNPFLNSYRTTVELSVQNVRIVVCVGDYGIRKCGRRVEGV